VAMPARMRGRWLSLAAAAVLVAGSACQSSEPDPPKPTDAASARDGGQIRVLETGFHMTPVPATAPGMTNRAIAAVIVENTSKNQEAETTQIRIRLLDANGAPVFHLGSAEEVQVSLPWIQPGQRFGIGYILTSDEKASANRTVTTMRVDVGKSYWRSPHKAQRVAMSDLHIQPRSDGGADLRYVATLPDGAAASPSDLAFRVYLLLRDGTGKLLGGWPVGDVHPLAGRSNGGETYTAEEWKKNVPADADLGKSEVYGAYGVG